MGPVRQRQLMCLSSVLVALNLAVGVTVVYAHTTGAAARQPRARVAPGATPSATGSPTTAGSGRSSGGGALAVGNFSDRRGSDTTSSTATAPGPAGTSPAATSPTPGVTGSSAPGTTGPPATTATTRATVGTTPTTSPAGTSTTAGKPSAVVPSAGSGVVTDRAGDTFVDGTQKPITEARADIVAAGAAFGPGGLTFTLQVRQPDDPRTDPKWSSDATFVTWDVDTTGDGKPDFEVQYAYDGSQFAGQVTHPGDDDSVPAVCNAATAGYGTAGYSVTIDPACLGNPASLAFRATTYYDTNPKDDNADVASDIAPDGGLSFPITRPS